MSMYVSVYIAIGDRLQLLKNALILIAHATWVALSLLPCAALSQSNLHAQRGEATVLFETDAY